MQLPTAALRLPPLELREKRFPPTLFPDLQRLCQRESRNPTLPIETFHAFATELDTARRERLSVLARISKSTATLEAAAEEELSLATDPTSNKRQNAYFAYLIGEYSQASKLVDELFLDLFPDASGLLSRAAASEAVLLAKTRVADLLEHIKRTLPGVETTGIRVKRPGSTLTKLIAEALSVGQASISRQQQLPRLLVHLPYDFIGARLVLTSHLGPFENSLYSIIQEFRELGIALEQKRRYQNDFMNAASLNGAFTRGTDNAIPVQLQVWDLPASRYEWLCHGNYKINRVLYPILQTWRQWLDCELDSREYRIAILRDLRRQLQ